MGKKSKRNRSSAKPSENGELESSSRVAPHHRTKMDGDEEAIKAIRELNESVLHGRRIVVKVADK